MDETITIIVLSLAELSLVASGFAIFFYFRSKKLKSESHKKSSPAENKSDSDTSIVHNYYYDQIQKLQDLIKDDLVEAKIAIDARIKILKNESMLLSKSEIDYDQQLKFYQTILATISDITQEPAPEVNTGIEPVTAKDDSLIELDELELPNSIASEDAPQEAVSSLPENDNQEQIKNIDEPGNDEEMEPQFDAQSSDTFDTDFEELEEYEEERFEAIAEDEFDSFDSEEHETAMEDTFATDNEEYEFVAEEDNEFVNENEAEEYFEEENELLAESGEEEILEEKNESLTTNEDEELIEEENISFTEPAEVEFSASDEDDSFSNNIPVLQDTIELDAPLITGELKNESAEIGKIRNIVSSLHKTIEELKEFSDEHELDPDADEYLTAKLEEIEISNARLNLCTETLEKDNARLLELVNQKDEQLEKETVSSSNGELNTEMLDDQIIPEKDRKEKIELLEVELSSLEKRLDDKTNRLESLQSLETDLSHVDSEDNAETFNQLMSEIDNLTDLLTTKSEELSKLRVHAFNPEVEQPLQTKTGT